MVTGPRFNEDKLWEAIRVMHKEDRRFHSLVLGNEYRLVQVDESARTYTIQYESGKRRVIPLRDLYAIYVELYRIGRMPHDYLRAEANGRRVVGHNRYAGSPGASIFGILPRLDDRIVPDGKGNLRVRFVPSTDPERRPDHRGHPDVGRTPRQPSKFNE